MARKGKPAGNGEGEDGLPRLPVHRGANPVFFEAYEGTPPWDIGRAQPAFVELGNEGLIRGSILDLGCGTGDLVMEMAEEGHEAWGVDIVPAAIRQARTKAKLRGLEREVTFLVGDALEVEHLGRRFDTVLDCGLFHTFSDPERILYEQQLRTVVKPGGRFVVMAMSDWEDESWGGPRRISQQDLLDTFAEGWRVDDIREARFLVAPPFRIRGHAWLAIVVRDAKRKPPRKRAAKVLPPDAAGVKPRKAARKAVAPVP